jgi:hypothetical protein
MPQPPDDAGAGHGVVVLDLGELELLSSTALKGVRTYHAKLVAAGQGLVLTGVAPRPREILERTGQLEALGPENVLPRTATSPDRRSSDATAGRSCSTSCKALPAHRPPRMDEHVRAWV